MKQSYSFAIDLYTPYGVYKIYGFANIHVIGARDNEIQTILKDSLTK